MKFEEQLLKTKPSEMYMDVLTGLELSVSMQLVFLFLCVFFFLFLFPLSVVIQDRYMCLM